MKELKRQRKKERKKAKNDSKLFRLSFIKSCFYLEGETFKQFSAIGKKRKRKRKSGKFSVSFFFFFSNFFLSFFPNKKY